MRILLFLIAIAKFDYLDASPVEMGNSYTFVAIDSTLDHQWMPFVLGSGMFQLSESDWLKAMGPIVFGRIVRPLDLHETESLKRLRVLLLRTQTFRHLNPDYNRARDIHWGLFVLRNGYLSIPSDQWGSHGRSLLRLMDRNPDLVFPNGYDTGIFTEIVSILSNWEDDPPSLDGLYI